jgi:hypothetical protein
MSNFKKIMAVAMVFVMTVAMATMGFAKTAESVSISDTLYTYDADSKTLEAVSGTDYTIGENLYLVVDDVTPESATPTVTDLKNYRLKSKFTSGKNLISDVAFDVIKVDSDKVLVIKISVNDTYSADEVDLEGTITVSSRSGATVNDGTESTITIDGVMSYGDVQTASSVCTVTSPIVNFDDCDEVELRFDDGIYYEVNAKWQKDLFLRYNGDADEALYDKYPDADLTFVNFDGNNKTFLRLGTLHIPYESDTTPFIYERTSDGLKLVYNAYDADEQEFAIKTRELKNYIISDVELVESVSDDTTVSVVTPDNALPANPSTGAEESNDTLLIVLLVLTLVVECVHLGLHISASKTKKGKD